MRLAYHQTHGGPMIEDLYAWLTAQLAYHLVEPSDASTGRPGLTVLFRLGDAAQ